MDLHLSSDPYESFRIFQGRILEQYLAMSTEFGFLVIDANQVVEAQQKVIRELVAQKIDLSSFKRAEILPPKTSRRVRPLKVAPTKMVEQEAEL
jgi:hypothetical protein